MAKKKSPDTNVNQTRTFVKGLTRDADASFIQEGMWNYARNAVNNTREGEIGTLSNEESNALCGVIGADITIDKEVVIIGAINLFESKWVIYSVIYEKTTLNTVITSEIGLFEEEFCRYRPIVRDKCLNFSKFNLVSGASREKGDCTWQVYWADGSNPDRYLNIGDPKLWPSDDFTWLGGLDGSSTINYYTNAVGVTMLWPGVAWVEDCDTVNDCIICTDLNKLNCDDVRLASLVTTPCIDLSVGVQEGTILNGSYAVGLAYTINDQAVTNYFSLSAVQPVFNEVDGKGSLEINIKDLDSEHFDQFELAVVYMNKQVVNYKILGYYNIDNDKIIIDQIAATLEDSDPTSLFQLNPVIETSEQIVEANRYLLKIGPKSKFDFNYQPLANLIKAEWVSVEYPERYYITGGSNTGYLRDEVYTFFIRWVYDTGDKSASYHIPGRPPVQYDGILEAGESYSTGNSFPGENQLFETVNTATVIPQSPAIEIEDGGKIIAYGNMGYWQSTEIYPSDRPDIWNSSEYPWTNVGNDTTYDLCGKNIRHHRFPENGIHPNAYHFTKKSDGTFHIRLMGVRFRNIVIPKDNDGNDIQGIVGYEILRGSREGNKSIVAKGMLNNFRDYTLQGETDASPKVGLYANYPFNTIKPVGNQTANPLLFNYLYNDPYIVSRDGEEGFFQGDAEYVKVNQDIPKSMLSFHSPDTSFKTPYLQMSELKVYGHLEGTANQRFVEAPNHPQFQLLADMILLVGAIGGIVNTIFKQSGNIEINYPAGKWEPQWVPNITGGDKNNKPAYKWSINGTFLPSSTTIIGGTGTPGGNDNNPAANIDTSIITNELDSNGNPKEVLGNQNDYDELIDDDQDPNEVQDEITGWKAFINQFPGIIPGTGSDSLDQIMVKQNQKIFDKGKYLTTPFIKRNYTSKDVLPAVIQSLSSSFGEILFNFLEGVDITVDLLKAIGSFRQYALELIGHGDYDTFVPSTASIDRFSLEDGIYVFSDIQDFPEFQDTAGNSVSYRINNLNRPHKVVIRVETPNGVQTGPDFITDDSGNFFDKSLMTLDIASSLVPDFDVNHKPEGKKKPFNNPIASHYGGLKFSIRNQYGQLNTISQIIATPCEQKIDFNTIGENIGASVQKVISETSTFFGGDTYINRFTEKNIMPFFTAWLYDQPRGTEWNYFLYPSVPFPRFWANSEPWDISEINVDDFLSSIVSPNLTGTGLLPSAYYKLDSENYNRQLNTTVDYPGIITPKNSFFYLAACGIRDFFVESDVIVDFRVRGDFERQYHYDKYRYTDLEALFDTKPEILTAGNYYNYDFSLSISNFFITQLYNFGYLQSRSYDPTVAELCFTSQPNVINYSLPETQESLIESWRTFLPLNKVVFKNNVNSVKSYAQTGMLVTFENASPLLYAGVDQREDYLGVAATIGDGLLFSATPRNVTAADAKFEYGSSQDRLAVASTPAGLYYMSQQQGKIFSFGQSLQEISAINMKWWFEEFLPYKLTEDFPDFPYVDNPVAGIGCSIGYNNSDSILYFSKKDYMLKPEYKGLVEYLDEDRFTVDLGQGNRVVVNLGDETIFEDASWTISYDPKAKQWISFHDWHPNLYLSGRNKHYTSKLGGIWEHNAGCNNYCNFYGTQHPFEIGVPFPTGQNVTTMKSIEYYLECYKRDELFCVDQFHVLDYNFDQAIVFNSEQVSGYLNLNIFPKNNIVLAQQYPIVNLDSVDILVSKEEQKYRFNQFWDITKDRGEFPEGSSYPPTGPLIQGTTTLLGNYAQNQIWNTKANGYVQDLNPVNLNYNKPQLQRKKFRHYVNYLKLIKNNPQDVNMVFKILNSKNQISQR